MSIKVQNLTKSFRDKKVLNSVSFEVADGETLAIVGFSGSGKSTILKLICNLTTPDSGTITTSEGDIAMSFQYSALFDSLNVEDNIKLVLEMNDKLTVDEKKRKLEELLYEFGVLKLRKAPSIALSGGERRRVEIARALAASPDFMLLDEPFAGIDPIAIGEIKDNIRKISEEKGLGVLITDHNPKETLSITDRAYVIFDGKIKIQGRSVDVANDPVAKEFYLGKDFQL